ncbi:hypothetical protein Tco_0873397 [Tanacetum coccineum]
MQALQQSGLSPATCRVIPQRHVVGDSDMKAKLLSLAAWSILPGISLVRSTCNFMATVITVIDAALRVKNLQETRIFYFEDHATNLQPWQGCKLMMPLQYRSQSTPWADYTLSLDSLHNLHVHNTAAISIHRLQIGWCLSKRIRRDNGGRQVIHL